ncbi:GTPase-binding protein rid1 [Echria macrotheca]|uniref:GTPase-binding protein rid1 n=1 Tax=Echria macrotheca TaxID=438768 RepID=A0AAJ0BKD5_9PEZI|nr:GTPase-binding protein rid1 [Echria macrotheca]
MPSFTDPYGVPTLNHAAGPASSSQQAPHQRTKSSVLRSLMGHKRNNSDGTSLPPAISTPNTAQQGLHTPASAVDLNPPHQHYLAPKMSMQALGEMKYNRQESSQRQRSPERPRDRSQASPSTTRATLANLSLKVITKEYSKPSKSKEPSSPTKPKKSKSATNLGALLSRPKSSKNLKQLVTDEEARAVKDKENRTPPSSVANDHGPPPPIYAQFTSQLFGGPSSPHRSSADLPGRQSADGTARPAVYPPENGVGKRRPMSYHPHATPVDDQADSRIARSKKSAEDAVRKRMTWAKGGDGKTKPTASAKPGPDIDPKDIDKHLEAMLDRRNIPENQRYKMRNLNATIKMEFVRQDWAEEQAKLERPGTNDSEGSAENSMASNPDKEGTKKKKHTRGLSLTIGKGANKAPSSPTKKQKTDSSLGRHFRSKSTESVVSDNASPAGETPTNGGFFAKVKGQQRPADFVSYLRKVQKPELVEVGKLHKLRLLLRNETVAWTEEFIRQGGMEEIVGLLHRIMAVEWREEHEDALLHENLLCLKALCTTALALQYLHSIHATLFPALLHMIFDPEKKGPSEFTTRNIITSVLLTYIECASPPDRLSRARTILGYLRDPEPKEAERPVSFVLEMRRDRPYRVWCKEVVSVTKEVFWIFLHNLNIITLPSSNTSLLEQIGGAVGSLAPTTSNGSQDTMRCDDELAYMARHFPQERPPVPAAPYVGGVEWDATNYLASHLDLMNAIIACTGPGAEERNALRAELRISGWERCLGGSLRLCKEKFYGAVHDGLRTWVAAAAEDGWDVRDVRYGPPPESRSASPVKKAGGGKKTEDAPRIEIPKLSFGIDRETPGPASLIDEAWLASGLSCGAAQHLPPWLPFFGRALEERVTWSEICGGDQ